MIPLRFEFNFKHYEISYFIYVIRVYQSILSKDLYSKIFKYAHSTFKDKYIRCLDISVPLVPTQRLNYLSCKFEIYLKTIENAYTFYTFLNLWKINLNKRKIFILSNRTYVYSIIELVYLRYYLFLLYYHQLTNEDVQKI